MEECLLLHSIAIPKHDMVSKGAVNVQIYLLDFRGKALCLFFHLLEGRGAEREEESGTISAPYLCPSTQGEGMLPRAGVCELHRAITEPLRDTATLQ